MALVSLSYILSQSTASAIAGSRSSLSSSTARQQTAGPHLNLFSRKAASQCDAPNTNKNEISTRNDISSSSHSPSILSILRSDCSTMPLLRKNKVADGTKPAAAVHNIKRQITADELTLLSWAEMEKAQVFASSGNPSMVSPFSCSTNLNDLLHEFLGKASSQRLMKLFNTQHLDIKLSQILKKIAPLASEEPLSHGRSDSVKSPWRESHVSSSSFLLNKQLPASGIGRSNWPSALAQGVWPQLLRVTEELSSMQRCGFKTVRTIEMETSRRSTVQDRLRSKIASPSVAPSPETSPRLQTLLEEESGTGKQEKLKVAFAEGYLAAEGGGKKKSRSMVWLQNVQRLLVIVVMLAVLSFLTRSMGGSLFRINVNNGNEVKPEEVTVSFDDVKGVEEAKQDLEEIVDFLQSPEKFKSLGAELPKGVLLVGPPGTGKTLLARAVAGEAGVPFFHVSGSEFDEILVGQGARRVRDLFRAAKTRAPCVIFIDEIDSVGAKRTNSVLHPYANQTINQLLAEMDGFRKNEGVIVLGATNRRQDLDKALMRPGRFDVEVQVPIPDQEGRQEIFDYYLGKVKKASDVKVDVMSRGTRGFTGADIKNVVNQAALRAAAELVDSVSMKYLQAARDKVLMGPERKSRTPDEEVNKVTAYHECGHALVNHYTKHSDPLHKVTIISRGHSLGHTAFIPAKEHYSFTRAQMLATMDSTMGGRAAEHLIFGGEMVTSGCSNDLKHATNVATQMVKHYGMSDRIGLRTFEDTSEQPFGGGEVIGTTTTDAIDAEINRLLQESYDRALNILKTHSGELKALAEALLKYETLDGDDVKAILERKGVAKDV